MQCILAHPPRYMPIIPMVLVNGAEGIGTGWSTFVPNYNPRDIAENLKARATAPCTRAPLGLSCMPC